MRRKLWFAVAAVEAVVICAFALALVLGHGVRGTSQPAAVVRQWWVGDVVYRVPTTEKVVALTYDDGPHPVYTKRILEILANANVKATFFMIGAEMDRYPDLVREIVREGHAVGNHTYTHPHDIRVDTRAQVTEELEKCEATIERITGKRPHLFRPPRGMLDSTVYSIATEEGYRVALWTVCADHHDAPTPIAMAQRVLDHVRPGAIILAHDGTFDSRYKDVEATPLIIQGLRKMGYRFVTLPQLLALTEKKPTRKRDIL
jgi:peptidoglycan-N-acetylglucosamine deacetylase